jgi:hypothetical protein
METIAEKPGVTFAAPTAGQGHAGKLRSSKDEVNIAKKQLEEKVGWATVACRQQQARQASTTSSTAIGPYKIYVKQRMFIFQQ